MITLTRKLHFQRSAHGRLCVTRESAPERIVSPGHIPRISRLMALAIRLDGLLRSNQISDISELARLAHVSQPRMTQILNLNHLAPDIQEDLLFLPPVLAGDDPITEKMLRPIAAEINWRKQRRQYRRLNPADSSKRC